MTDHLLYLHGFRSSPQSFKAVRLQAWLAQHRPDVSWCCPQLPPSPAEAIATAGDLLRRWPAGRSAVLGSSLGGFYAAWLGAEHHCPVVLMNPAAHPARDLAPLVGKLAAFHDPTQCFDFTAQHVQELRALEQSRQALRAPGLAIIAKGDEVLDWREMCAFSSGCRLHLIEGSDHGLSDFDSHLPTLLHFLQLPSPN
jgi:uncharacterized protein